MTEEQPESPPLALIIDADPDIIEMLSFEFEMRGMRVESARTADEGIEKYQALKPDAIVADAMISNGKRVKLIDWFEQNLPEKKEERPVLIMLGNFIEQSISPLMEKGVEATFVKPFSLQAVSTRLFKALEVRKHLKLRSFERFDVIYPVTYQHNGNQIKAEINNLGRGGMFVVVDRDYPADQSTIEFKLTASDKKSVYVVVGTSIVRWVKKGSGDEGFTGFGVKFDQMNEQSLKALNFVINHLKVKDEA